MVRILFFLQTGFSLWLVIDAIRRGAAYYWYPIIMMPFGEWVYFFTIKIHDPEFDWARELYTKLTTKKVTLEERRQRAEHSPSFANKVELAQALHDAGAYGEAAEIFTEALKMPVESREALYGLALARSALGEYSQAIEHFTELIELDPSFRDYAAYSDLAHALAQDGRLDEAQELLDGLVIKSPRLAHRVIYAHYLTTGEKRDQAREQLEAGLREIAGAPKYVQRRNRAWSRRAKQMLQQLS